MSDEDLATREEEAQALYDRGFWFASAEEWVDIGSRWLSLSMSSEKRSLDAHLERAENAFRRAAGSLDRLADHVGRNRSTL